MVRRLEFDLQLHRLAAAAVPGTTNVGYIRMKFFTNACHYKNLNVGGLNSYVIVIQNGESTNPILNFGKIVITSPRIDGLDSNFVCDQNDIQVKFKMAAATIFNLIKVPLLCRGYKTWYMLMQNDIRNGFHEQNLQI